MFTHVLGIDIAKRTFDVALLPTTLPADPRRERPRTAHFANTTAGIAALLRWLPVERGPLHVCLEATSTYGLAVADALVAAGCTVSVVTPYQVKHFAHSELQRSKTDRTDAAVLARFCRSQRPSPWTPPTPAARELRGLVRRLADVQQLIAEEKNRAQVPAQPDSVLASIGVVLTALNAEAQALGAAIDALLAHEPALTQAVALVATIPGIGRATAIILVAELGDLSRFRSARDVAAYAGLIPAHRQSGTSLKGKPRLSKQGAGRLRHALFYPALSARRYNPVINAFAERLQAKGKATMAIIGAVMHKLIRIVYGVLKSGQPFRADKTT